MENKLGNYFTKGLQAGVLATALIAGNVSCSQPSGGSEPEFNGGNGNGNGGNGGGQWEQPAYMNVTADFGGQQFLKLDNGLRWANDQNRNENFDTSYNNAQNFLENELTKLQNTVNNGNTGSLTNEINTLLNGYNNGTNLKNKIDKNFEALAPIIYNMTKELSDNDYQEYKISYYKLAHNAYQNSLSSLKDNTTLKVNQEMKNDIYPNNFFARELAKTKYNDLSLPDAETLMENKLYKISNNTRSDLKVLKKIIALALYNESLYGLNDYAVTEKVTNGYLRYQHSITDLDTSVIDYRNNMTRNIDNGFTM